MKSRRTQSALLVAGAAVGAAAAWVGKRRYAARAEPSEAESAPESLRSSDFIELVSEDVIEIDGPELPLGRSADPEIDGALHPSGLGQDDTTGAALSGAPQPARSRVEGDSLDEIWDASPRPTEPREPEGYDAVSPEDLGSVWLSRATQTTPDDNPHVGDPDDLPGLEGLMISEATRASALPLDEEVDDEEADDEEADDQEADDEEADDQARGRAARVTPPSPDARPDVRKP